MPKADPDPRSLFSDRVEDYVRYRPGYPKGVLDLLRARAGLETGSPVADVGSGTGIFTRLLLEAGAKVFAVEPNDAMRAAAEAELGGMPGFVSVPGTAEATSLPPRSVSLVTCAQAFHWFGLEKTRLEFARILRNGGACALVWNTALERASEFAVGYEDIKSKFRTDLGRIPHQGLQAAKAFDRFFGPGSWERHVFGNFQTLDFEALRGRLLSSSYAPKPGHPAYEAMLGALKTLFERCQAAGTVRMDYETEVFLGRLPDSGSK